MKEDNNSQFSILNSPLIPPGYKQTEVGVIPEDWEPRRLKDLFSIKSGFAFSSAYFSEKGPICLTPGNFKLDGGLYFNERNTKRYSGPYSSSMAFEYGDLLIVMTDLTPECNLLGKPAFVRLREPLLHNQRIGKIIPHSSRISLKFLYWYFLSHVHSTRMKETATGSTVRHTSNSSIYSSWISLPPTKAEQEAIAEVLSDADALIESLEQLLTKKRHLKQGAMQELLTGKKRLPGFSGEWEVKRLGDICRITTGKKDVNEGNPDGQFPFYTCSRSHTFSDSYSFDTEAILIAGNGDVGNLHYFKGKFEAYQRTYILSEFSGNVGYLWQELSAYLADSLGLGKIGSSIPYIKKENIFSFEFHSPLDEAEQTAIAAILSDMDAEIAALETKLAKTRQLKQGMMQELLTGRIRLIN
jgi:type I restriction enzyme S subunit